MKRYVTFGDIVSIACGTRAWRLYALCRWSDKYATEVNKIERQRSINPNIYKGQQSEILDLDEHASLSLDTRALYFWVLHAFMFFFLLNSTSSTSAL